MLTVLPSNYSTCKITHTRSNHHHFGVWGASHPFQPLLFFLLYWILRLVLYSNFWLWTSSVNNY